MAHRKKRRGAVSEAYRHRRRVYRNRTILALGLMLLAAVGVKGLKEKFFSGEGSGSFSSAVLDTTVNVWLGAPDLDVQLLTPNSYSRPQTELKSINGIVIHYTANPGTMAQANRNYFEELKDSHATKASSHFIVGLDGEVIQCIPTTEWAYASNDRNKDTLSVECCHPDETGKFNDATYQSAIQLTGWLCVRFHLDESDVIRHYDVTGKNCPKYYVEHADAWEQFRSDVKSKIQEIREIQQG